MGISFQNMLKWSLKTTEFCHYSFAIFEFCWMPYAAVRPFPRLKGSGARGSSSSPKKKKKKKNQRKACVHLITLLKARLGPTIPCDILIKTLQSANTCLGVALQRLRTGSVSFSFPSPHFLKIESIINFCFLSEISFYYWL